MEFNWYKQLRKQQDVLTKELQNLSELNLCQENVYCVKESKQNNLWYKKSVLPHNTLILLNIVRSL